MRKLGLLSTVVGAMVLAATPVSLRLPSNDTSALAVDTAAAQTTPAPAAAAPAATGTYGMQRRQERRSDRYQRRDDRRDNRVERRTGTTTGAAPASK